MSVVLVNEGLNTFKKAEYGSRIIICRNLTRTGANSYICKSSSGKVVSRKRKEVDNIVMAFNWQIENPICILNQDVARSFLCSTNNEIRFKMFTKSTQLESLKKIYDNTVDLLVMTKTKLSKKKMVKI